MIDPYRIAISIASRLAGAFYEITHLRPAGVPAAIEGPAVVVSNHPNSVLDPVLVASSTPTELRFLAKAPLFSTPIVGPIIRSVRALPVHRKQDGADTTGNAYTFDTVAKTLLDGDVIAIFPEGRSVETTQLLELRTGAARMVIGGLVAGAPHVDIVPIGIWFAEKARFRSSAATVRGVRIRITDPTTDVLELTKQIDAALRSTTVNSRSGSDLVLALRLADFRRIPRPHHAAAVATQARWIENSADDKAREALDRAFNRAEWLGATAYELGDLEAVARRRLGADLVATLILAPGAVVGAVGAAPPFYATDLVARRFIKSPTDASMLKIASGALLYPLWGWILHRVLRALGLAPIFAAAGVFGVWILHVTARPTFASLRRRWSGRRLTRRMSTMPALRIELEAIAAQIRRLLSEADHEPDLD